MPPSSMNINAAKGLYDVMKSNLGPKGTIKMLVGGSGGTRPHKSTSCALVYSNEAIFSLFSMLERRSMMCVMATMQTSS